MIVQKQDFPDIMIFWRDMFVLCWNTPASTLLYYGVLYNPFGFKIFLTETCYALRIAFLYYLTVRERDKDFKKYNNRSFHELRLSLFHSTFFFLLESTWIFIFFHASTVVYLISCALQLLCSCQAFPKDCLWHLCKAVSCGRFNLLSALRFPNY